MKSTILFLFLSTSLLSQTPKQYKFALGGHYLPTKDYSIQQPDGGNAFACVTPGGYPSFEIQLDLPITNLFQFETGYRFKQHPIAYKGEGYLASEWAETTHSFPLRIGIGSKLWPTGFFSKFSFAFSGGVLLDIMRQSISNPLLISGQYQQNTPSGPYLFVVDYNPNEVNQVKASVSFNGQARFSYRLLKFLDIYFGYGYTYGTRTLAKGYYAVQNPMGIITKGSMATKGSYRYSTFGLRFLLKKT